MASSFTYPPPPIQDGAVKPDRKLTDAWERWFADLSARMNSDRTGVPNVRSFANNAAAVAAGLAKDEVYAVTGSNPRLLAVVY